MKLSIFLLLVAARGAFAQEPDPDAAGQKRIIAEVQAKTLDYLKNPPNFSCTEVMRHNVDSSGTNAKWKLLETIHERLTLIGQKEDLEVLSIGGKKPGNPENRPAGSVSLSELNTVLSDIFDPKAKADFSWGKWDSLRGHRVHEIGYKVLKENSSMTIGKKDLTVGLLGLIFADADTGLVLRVSNVASDIPAKYPLQGVTMDLNWEFMKIGDRLALVPIAADMKEKDGKSLVWNEIEFRDFKAEPLNKAAR